MAGDLLPYFKFYPAETIADERFAGWTLEERGAWLTLLLHAWVNGSIPSDEDSLSRLLHIDATAMRSLWRAIGDRFGATKNMPKNRVSSLRLELERSEAIARARAGKTGAKHRWKKEKSSHATALRPHCDRNAEPMPPEQSRAEQSRTEQKPPKPPASGGPGETALAPVEPHRPRRAARLGPGHPAWEAIAHWTDTTWPRISGTAAEPVTTSQAQALAELCGRRGPAEVTAAMDRAASDEFWAPKLTLASFVAQFDRFLPRKTNGASRPPAPPPPACEQWAQTLAELDNRNVAEELNRAVVNAEITDGALTLNVPDWKRADYLGERRSAIQEAAAKHGIQTVIIHVKGSEAI